MKTFNMILTVMFMTVAFGITAAGQQICTGGILFTSCYPWTSAATTGYPNGDGFLPNGKPNDTPRLQRAIDANPAKIVFNEAEYYLGVPAASPSYSPTLNVKSYRILEGTGRSAGVGTPIHLTSKIIQTKDNAAIFKIGTGINEISIRDIALVAGAGTTGTMGILAEGNCLTAGCSSVGAQFSNLKFTGLFKGIYVNAIDGGATAHNWQFDNVRLDHVFFDHCDTGVHINSYNSGWNISSIEFLSPAGGIGFYFERSTYTSVNMVIGNGTIATPASQLFKIKEHANLSIQNSVSEGFLEDVNINNPSAIGAASPITLMNNHFNGKVTVNNGNVVSIGNTFGFQSSPPGPAVQAIATSYSSIFSLGDKLCDYNVPCTNKWQIDATSKLVFGSDVFKTTTTSPVSINRDVVWSDLTPSLSIIAPTLAVGPLMRLGRGNYFFDVSRSEADATLTFMPNVNGYGYTFNGRGGNFNITGSYLKFSPDVANGYGNGTITLGTMNFSNLGTADNGTMWFCSDCQETNPCTGGGSGAIAKRLPSKWTCN
jgi:hypothetical protein